MEEEIDQIDLMESTLKNVRNPNLETSNLQGQIVFDKPQEYSSIADFVRHRGPVTSTADVLGMNKVITGGYDGAVAIFDLDSGDVQLLGYHGHLVNQVAVDNVTGKRAASCSSDYTVRLWDLEKGACTRVLRGHADDVEDFVFVDDKTGISASRDRRIIIWDLDTGAIRHILDAHDKDVLSLSYSDGLLYSSGDDKTLRVWNVDTGELLNTFGPFDLETDTCAIDPVNRRVVIGCDDGIVRVIDVESGTIIREIAAHSSGIKKVAVSPAGDILSAAYDQRIIIWCGISLEKKLQLENVKHKWERSFSFSQDGTNIFAGTFDGTLLKWDALDGSLLSEVGADGDGNACFNRVAATHDGSVVTVSDDGRIRLADFNSQAARWIDCTKPVSGRMLMNAVAIDAAGEFVVSGAHDQKLHMNDVVGNKLVNHREVSLDEGPINFVEIATQPNFEKNSFVACYSGKVVCVTPKGVIRFRTQIHEGAVKSVRLHQSAEFGISCSADGTLRSWTYDGRIVDHYYGHSAIINDVAFSPSGKLVASVSRDFTLKVYQFVGGKLLESMELGRRSLKSVCFASEDIVFIGDYWGGLFRVDLKSGETKQLQVATNGLSSLARSGSKVIAASYEGSVCSIDSSSLVVLQRIEAMKQCLKLQIEGCSNENKQNNFGVLARAKLPIVTGKLVDAVVFGSDSSNPDVIALINKKPNSKSERALVRLHSACITSEVLGSLKCDCACQLDSAISMISESDWGILIYLLKHEGRGIGLVNKIHAYALQDKGLDTVDANVALGFGADDRDFEPAVLALKLLGVERVDLLSNNPDKEKALRSSGIDVAQRIPMDVPITEHNRDYLYTKQQFFGHQPFRDPTTEFMSSMASANVFEKEISKCKGVVSTLAIQIEKLDSQSKDIKEVLVASVAEAIKFCEPLNEALIARVSDDRFLIMLPDSEKEAARAVAKEIYYAVNELHLTTVGDSDKVRPLTISIGVASSLPDENTKNVFAGAVESLEKALDSGGDQIVMDIECRTCFA